MWDLFFQQEKLLGHSGMISWFWWWVAGTKQQQQGQDTLGYSGFGVPHLFGIGLLALD